MINMKSTGRDAAAVLVLAAAALIGGCSDGAQQREVGGITLSAVTDPAVPQVGRSALITAKLHRDGSPVGDCRLRMRQFMPGMEMSGDDTWHALAPAQSPGTYQATSGEFSMGGDWQIEFVLECGDAVHTVAIPYHLEWPE